MTSSIRHLKRCIIIMAVMMVVANGISQDADFAVMKQNGDKNSGYDFRIGHLYRPDVDSIYQFYLYYVIEEKMRYHIFLADGKELYSSTNFVRTNLEFGPDDIRITWRLIPDSGKAPFDLPEHRDSYLVIGTSGKKRFSSPRIKPVTKKQQDLCITALTATDTLMSDATQGKNVHCYSAGSDSRVTRIFIEQDYGCIALCHVGEGECRILFARSSFSDERTGLFCGQADLDGDGMSDVFAVDGGDFQGKWILMNENGEWIFQQADLDNPF